MFILTVLAMDRITHFFSSIQFSLKKNKIERFFLKPKQVLCLEYVINGFDVLAVLPTGYGKSMLYQLLPFIIPVQKNRNIVIVVSPLNAIIEDQKNVLLERGIKVGTLTCEKKEKEGKLFNIWTVVVMLTTRMMLLNKFVQKLDVVTLIFCMVIQKRCYPVQEELY